MFPLNDIPSLPTGPMLFVALALIIIASGVPVVAVVVAAEPILMTLVVLTAHGGPSVAELLALTVAASVAGDVVSYGLGRWFGPRLSQLRVVRRSRRRLVGAQRTVRRRGMMGAVIAQRWVPPTRGFLPALLGAGRQPFGPFVGYTAVAAAVWGVVIVIGTHFGGPVLVLMLPTAVLVVTLVRAARRLLPSLFGRQSGAL